MKASQDRATTYTLDNTQSYTQSITIIERKLSVFFTV